MRTRSGPGGKKPETAPEAGDDTTQANAVVVNEIPLPPAASETSLETISNAGDLITDTTSESDIQDVLSQPAEVLTQPSTSETPAPETASLPSQAQNSSTSTQDAVIEEGEILPSAVSQEPMKTQIVAPPFVTQPPLLTKPPPISQPPLLSHPPLLTTPPQPVPPPYQETMYGPPPHNPYHPPPHLQGYACGPYSGPPGGYQPDYYPPPGYPGPPQQGGYSHMEPYQEPPPCSYPQQQQEEAPMDINCMLGDIRAQHEETLDPFERFKANFIGENSRAGDSTNEPEAKITLEMDFDMMGKVIHRFENSCKKSQKVQKTPAAILNEIFIGMCPINFNCALDGPSHMPILYASLEIPVLGKFQLISRGSKQDTKHKISSHVCATLHKLRQDFRKANLNREFRGNHNSRNNNNNQRASGRPQDMELGNGERKRKVEEIQPQGSPMVTDNQDDQKEDIDYESTVSAEAILEPSKASAIYNCIQQQSEQYLTPLTLDRMFDHLSDHQKHQLSQQQLWRYQEIAGFLLEDTVSGRFQVLTFATGTKCILGENISLEGDTLFDCHAEILARRALKALLMEQISMILANNLQDKEDFWLYLNNGLFELKPNLKIHLYISSPPCGDSRMFNFNEKKKTERNSISRGLLRHKIEKGQGTIPTNLKYISRWDAYLASEDRIRIMSCSDKVAMWNFCGIQGSLLSNFMRPIYIDSLVVTYLFRPVPLMRALYERIPKDVSTQEIAPYHINAHKVARSHRDNSMQDKNSVFPTPPTVSHIWADFRMEDKDLELIKADTGKQLLASVDSKYCKMAMSNRFLRLIYGYDGKIPSVEFDSNQMKDMFSRTDTDGFFKSYNYLKSLSKTYQNAKYAFLMGLHNAQLGDWNKFSCDANLFSIC